VLDASGVPFEFSTRSCRNSGSRLFIVLEEGAGSDEVAQHLEVERQLGVLVVRRGRSACRVFF
jgi:hypothetical protein